MYNFVSTLAMVGKSPIGETVLAQWRSKWCWSNYDTPTNIADFGITRDMRLKLGDRIVPYVSP